MIIVIPTNGNKGLEEETAEHFGRCNTYTFIDESGKVVEIIDNTSGHMGGTGLPPELMKEHGANILLCKSLGPRALDICKRLGIEVYVCREGSVRGMFESWKLNRAKKATLDDICEEHGG